MKVKEFSWYSWVIVVLVLGSLFLLFFFGSNSMSSEFGVVNLKSQFNTYFVLDFVGFSLSLIAIFLALAILFFFNVLSSCSVNFVLLSLISAVLSFNANHAFVFWWFYEMSIISLLYLLIVESPYSERYIAGWYLSGYVVLTSLPMLLCIVYFVVSHGSWNIGEWQMHGNAGISFSGEVMILLSILFVTKIPLPPFHVWLPIVHAEATSVVSVCLSGYIMKLGLLGVVRFCWWVAPDVVFNLTYVGVVFLLSLLFFMIASWELDGKRWLAFLSLSHIVVCIVCLNSAFFNNGGLFLVYSLGHGLSAGLVFVLLWWGYELSGSRNWLILKSVLGGSNMFRFLYTGCLCTAASLPPVLNFFVEINILNSVGVSSVLLFYVFCFYLFLSSLIPLFLVGISLSRQFCHTVNTTNSVVQWNLFIFFILTWSFIIFIYM
uniref:NADH-ubiquinone oxidoreductase chain 4 n=1 Tax=Posthodiplostomum centrarchi TaxID=1954244 RepID=A0A6J3YMH1_9TREM|nr:NADH dehydrogenase subunit 4 [Posthodiplostomum centrarchi]